ncbi:hypothetical protein CAEBREN_11359 [Caenorhabditis brenneri]|uniref:F-box domain-containing protein n=1 Tax=Caenorhabditis brenneri TaxID=135651 RepID=G0N099_CAEBE|nr:hypothetical protein CAEBREN_11359 [Caenorhabditis brenneri]
MSPTFPLLRLPNEERLAVLRQMGMSHLVELSIWKLPSAPLKVKSPRYVTILKNSPNDTLIKCTKEEYEAKDWLEHLCQIFHRKNHSLIVERHGSRYDLNSVYENFKNPSFFALSATGNTGYSNRVTDTESFAVKGGREIRRMDGTVCRIVIDNQRRRFKFFIWYE